MLIWVQSRHVDDLIPHPFDSCGAGTITPPLTKLLGLISWNGNCWGRGPAERVMYMAQVLVVPWPSPVPPSSGSVVGPCSSRGRAQAELRMVSHSTLLSPGCPLHWGREGTSCMVEGQAHLQACFGLAAATPYQSVLDH